MSTILNKLNGVIILILFANSTCKNDLNNSLLFFEYETTHCEAFCPVFKIKIELSGRITYYSIENNMLKPGKYYSLLDSNEVKKIFLFKYDQILKFKDDYISNEDPLDHPCRFFYFKFQYSDKYIRDCLVKNKQEDLNYLSNKIDSIIINTTWIKDTLM